MPAFGPLLCIRNEINLKTLLKFLKIPLNVMRGEDFYERL